MPTPEAEEIVKAIWTDARGDIDALSTVTAWAPRIDAMMLQKIVEMETSWRRALQLERDARAKAEADQRRYMLLRWRETRRYIKSGSQNYQHFMDAYDAGVDFAIGAGEGQG